MAGTNQNKKVQKTEESVEELKKRIEKEKMSALSEMADVIGHDLKNPLSNIRNSLYLIEKAVDSQDRTAVRMLEIIEQEINSITDILDNLTCYARHKPPALSQTEINKLIDDAIADIEIPESIQVETHIPDDLPIYNLDRSEIKLALLNVLGNAVEACEPDEGLIRVSVTLNSDNDLRFKICDNGEGIKPEKLAEICNPFTSTKGGKTGLGMAAVKNIVERHCGNLDISSEPNQGTEVVIQLPMLSKTE